MSIKKLPYQAYFPPTYPDAGVKYPLLVFMHGSGERSDKLNHELLWKNGLPELSHKVMNSAVEQQFAMFVPQCPVGQSWESQLEAMDAVLREFIRNHREEIDISRIWLTGISWGGAGAWYHAWKRQFLYAAVSPVCGSRVDCDIFHQSYHELQLPIAVFHSKKDIAVPVSETLNLVKAIKQHNPNVEEMIYDLHAGETDFCHKAHAESWRQAYQDNRWYQWLFSNQKDCTRDIEQWVLS